MAGETEAGKAIARAIAMTALQLGAGGGMSGIILGSLGGGRAGAASDGEYPSPLHTVNVKYVGGKTPQMNAGVNRSIGESAGRMQTLEEHQAALNGPLIELLRKKPNATDREKHLAIVQGAEDEAKLLSYWDDRKPRKKFAGRSSAVRAVRITPDHRIQVQWGTSPTWYTYKAHPNAYEASLVARRLLLSDSLGQSVYPDRGWFSKEENDDSMRPTGKR